jgi:hypothetical protein
MHNHNKPTCTGPECERNVVGRKPYCPAHQRQVLRGRPLTALRDRASNRRVTPDGCMECASCKRIQPRGQFPNDNRGGTGHRPTCRLCRQGR